MKELIINDKNSGGRLDKLLSAYLNRAPKGFVYKMLRKKNIMLNDKKASGNEILKSGDIIKLYLSDETIQKFRPVTKTRANNSITTADTGYGKKVNTLNRINLFKSFICFEDDNIIAMNKPVGLLSQKSESKDVSLNEMLCDYLDSIDHSKDEIEFKAGISNRLDRNTSGIVMAGKNQNAVRVLNDAIKKRSLSKKYLCIVNGVIENAIQIDGYLIKDENLNKVKIYKECPENENAELIQTAYKPLMHNEKNTLLEVELITGKSHQIRAHLASEGHFLIGDEKYGDSKANTFFKEKYGLKWQLLHAYKVEFNNLEGCLSYLNGKAVYAEIPACFKKIMIGEKLNVNLEHQRS